MPATPHLADWNRCAAKWKRPAGSAIPPNVSGPKRDMEAIAQADWEMEKRLAYFPSGTTGLAEHYEGGSPFGEADLEAMGQAFFKIFGRPMPVSTRGESAVHRAMGFDHTGRFDVALSPSQPQGVWARHYLTAKHVTFCISHYWAGQHPPGTEELTRTGGPGLTHPYLICERNLKGSGALQCGA